MNTQAIILAAGMGKRLGKLTESNTKCMIKVNDITLIERMLHQIISFNIKKIILVVGFHAEVLRKFVDDLKLDAEIIFVENHIYDTTNNIYSLFLARQYLIDNNTLLFESDLIFEDSLLEQILTHPYPNLALVAKFESWMDGTVVKLSENSEITDFISKDGFVFEDIPNYYKTVNIYKFSKEFSETRYVPFLEAYCKALGNNQYYEQVLKVISILEKPDIKGLNIGNDVWYEIDDIQDLDIAESMFSSDATSLQNIQNRYGGYWRYPKLIDFCYLVNPFFPSDKLLSEVKANFDRLIREYPSGLRVNNLLAAKCFSIDIKYICVGNGAAELIRWLTMSMDGCVGIITPTFEEYPNRLKNHEKIVFTPKNLDFSYTQKDLIDFFTPHPISWLILINPDNPSGNFLRKDQLIQLLDWGITKGVNIVVDESFVDFSDTPEESSLLHNDLLEKYLNLVVIKSISKSYGVPGLRLGVLATSNSTILDRIKENISIWNINSFAEFYLQIYGKYELDYKIACVNFIEERNVFFKELSSIPFLRVIPSNANYFLCEVSIYTSKDLTLLLYKKGVLIKDCSEKDGFKGTNYVRIAVRSRNDNLKLINILNEL